MLEELIERYSQYSDGELMTVYLNKNGYTNEAQKALETVVERKGGIQSLKERYDKIVEKEDEKIKSSTIIGSIIGGIIGGTTGGMLWGLQMI
ncbi:hypothetical protein [Chryseobacterium mulctrae]|uniref:hypothetical protein n=1 Tax=Chryseobacterium mulctrae TaxID=2576777 RepID=UPI0011177806|nr:hypothetical protein [Chryseobacterium mulctrae]